MAYSPKTVMNLSNIIGSYLNVRFATGTIYIFIIAERSTSRSYYNGERHELFSPATKVKRVLKWAIKAFSHPLMRACPQRPQRVLPLDAHIGSFLVFWENLFEIRFATIHQTDSMPDMDRIRHQLNLRLTSTPSSSLENLHNDVFRTDWNAGTALLRSMRSNGNGSQHG